MFQDSKRLGHEISKRQFEIRQTAIFRHREFEVWKIPEARIGNQQFRTTISPTHFDHRLVLLVISRAKSD